MPPKKKKGSGNKGKKSGKKSAKGTPRAEHLNEVSKEFYLIQIKDLENRLTRYQKKCDELELLNETYQSDKEKTESNMKNIMDYLQSEIHKKDDTVLDLKDRLIGTQQAKDTEKEQYEMKLQQLRNEFQNMKDQLTSENMILGGKLASLEEFKVQKEDLTAKMLDLENQLEVQEQNHQEEIYSLERKQVVDKDRLKKEMVLRVNQVAAEFRKVSNKQMAETTKRTIRENVSINAQLAKMSDKTVELISESDELKDKDRRFKQQIDMLETNEKELAKKNLSNQKIIQMLTEKCKNQEALITEYEIREDQYQELEKEAELLRQQMEASREDMENMAEENDTVENRLADLNDQLKTEKSDKRKLERVMAEAADALKMVLRTSSTEDVDESPYDVIEKRDNMLENLLVLLNSAAAIGLGPAPGELGRDAHLPRPRSTSQIPGSGQGIRRGEVPLSPIAPRPIGTLPHYQLGDLGLVPRPQQHIPSHLDRMKELSTTTRLGNLKKVMTRSMATQTVSSPKAMFFADQLLSKLPGNTQLLQEFPPPKKPTVASILLPQGRMKVSNKVF